MSNPTLITPEEYLKLNWHSTREYNKHIYSLNLKFCPCCKQFLSFSNFEKSNKRRGILKLQSKCRDCRRRKQYEKLGYAEPPPRYVEPVAQDPINNKVCHKCKIEKSRNDFFVESVSKDGLNKWCKACNLDYKREHKEHYREKDRQRLLDNPELVEKRNKYSRENTFNNPILRERRKINCRKWRTENPDKKRKYDRAYNKYKSETDPAFKLKKNLRRSFTEYVGGRNKTSRLAKYLGIPYEEFRVFIENQFNGRWTWDDYGIEGFHIDHIVPFAIFDILNEEEMFLCWNYRNFQPLDSFENSGIKRESLPIARTHLLKQIEKNGNNDYYEKLLAFLDKKMIELKDSVRFMLC
jgi:hypothetical protein